MGVQNSLTNTNEDWEDNKAPPNYERVGRFWGWDFWQVRSFLIVASLSFTQKKCHIIAVKLEKSLIKFVLSDLTNELKVHFESDF